MYLCRPVADLGSISIDLQADQFAFNFLFFQYFYLDISKYFYEYFYEYLSIHISFSQHVNLICSKVSKSISILQKFLYVFPSNILCSFNFKFINPYFVYAIIAQLGFPDYNKNRTIKLQKKAIRIICDLSYPETTASRIKELGILPLSDLFKLQIRSYMLRGGRTIHPETIRLKKKKGKKPNLT